MSHTWKIYWSFTNHKKYVYLVLSCVYYKMVQPPPSAILETCLGWPPFSTSVTMLTVSSMSGKFMVDSLEWITVPLTVTSNEVLLPTLPVMNDPCNVEDSIIYRGVQNNGSMETHCTGTHCINTQQGGCICHFLMKAPTFNLRSRDRLHDGRAQFPHAGLVTSGATILDNNIYHGCLLQDISVIYL